MFFFGKLKDSFKSVDVAVVDMPVDVTKVDVAEVEVEMSVDVVVVEMISGLEVGICSLFVLSEKRIGGIFAIAKLEALKLSSALLN